MQHRWVRQWCGIACAVLSGILAPLPVSPVAAHAEDAPPASPPPAIVTLLAGDAGATDTEIAAELAYALADEPRLRILPVLDQGITPSVADLLSGKNIDVAILHTDALLATSPPRSSNLEYIAKLFQEEVHILAQDTMASVEGLNGKPVEVGPVGSATALTAHAILGALHVAPQELHDLDTVALERLRLGQAAAVFVVGGKPVPALLSIPPASGLHFLPIPLNPQLVNAYLPSLLESSSYPALVRPDQPVETLAVGALLVTLPHQADARGKRVDRFVDALFTHLAMLRQPGYHPKWGEVSLAAQFAGLKRYGHAERRLREAAQQTDTSREARH